MRPHRSRRQLAHALAALTASVAMLVTSPSTPVAEDEFAPLRGRPFVVPTLAFGGRCPVAPQGRSISNEFAPATGPGPVYPVGLSWPQGATLYPWESVVTAEEWYSVKVLWVAAPGYDGPVLIRGRQIDGDEVLRFAGSPDELDPELRWAGPRSGVRIGVPPTPDGFRQRPSHTRIRRPGCYVYQVDGTSFSYQIVVRVAERGEPMPGIGAEGAAG